MAFQIPGEDIGVEVAATDLTTHQFKAVEFTAYGVDLAPAESHDIGILQNDPDTDEAANVMISRVSKARAGAAFAKGADLMVGTSGKLIEATTGKPIVARALEAAGADGDLVAVKLGYKGLAA